MCVELPELSVLLNAIEQQDKERQTHAETDVWSPQWKHSSSWLNAEVWEDFPEPTYTKEDENFDGDEFVEKRRREMGFYDT